jgi:tetratricopeptide (TPR) repeat protein
VVGFSYGGFLAQYYTTHHPEYVAGLVLVGASPGIRADVGRSRQQDFISAEEREKKQQILAGLREVAQSRDWSPAEIQTLMVYNNFLNGDWKRQHYYKPTPDQMAQIALYEWIQDDNFNSAVGQSMGGIDFTGAFDASPIPTLILEGEWDLTWGPEKKEALAGNHPNGKLVTFEKAGHSIFNEDPDGFFSTLHEFIQALAPPDEDALAAYQAGLVGLREGWATARSSRPNTTDWGFAASQAIAESFGPDWAETFESPMEYLRLGFALYDMERYEEALRVFMVFQAWGEEEGEETLAGLASIWQGHMFDLLGRRREAIESYQRVADMDLDDTWSHGQYGMRYSLSPYARERLEAPFQRIENRER